MYYCFTISLFGDLRLVSFNLFAVACVGCIHISDLVFVGIFVLELFVIICLFAD